MTIQPGSIINGKYRYRILEITASQVVATVCLARVEETGQLLTLKVISAEAGRQFVSRFQREASARPENSGPALRIAPWPSPGA